MLNSTTSDRDLAGQVNGMEFCGNCKQYEVLSKAGLSSRRCPIFRGIVFDK